MVWTLIDHGKLANQIARLAAIMVKIWIVTAGGRGGGSLMRKGRGCPLNR